MNLIIVGHARHGKDEVCKLLAKKTSLKFVSSSWFLCEKLIYPLMKENYETPLDCFKDRVNHRGFWFDTICEYNLFDKARLCREIFEVADIYCGLRNIDELNAAKKEKLADHVIWVDALLRENPEPKTSMTIKESDADYVLDNNGTLQDLVFNINNMIDDLKIK